MKIISEYRPVIASKRKMPVVVTGSNLRFDGGGNKNQLFEQYDIEKVLSI